MVTGSVAHLGFMGGLFEAVHLVLRWSVGCLGFLDSHLRLYLRSSDTVAGSVGCLGLLDGSFESVEYLESSGGVFWIPG